MKPIKLYRNWADQPAGALWDDGVFRKTVKEGVHLFKNENGWGIDKKILDDLPPKTEIRIKSDKGNIYVTTKEIFLTHSQVDFGHGVQVIMWRGNFEKDGVKSTYVESWLNQYDLFENYGRA